MIEGAFALRLGIRGVPLDPELLTGDVLWVELTVEGELLDTRMPLASVPYAQRAAVAERSENADGLWVGETQVVDETGSWVGGASVVVSATTPRFRSAGVLEVGSIWHYLGKKT